MNERVKHILLDGLILFTVSTTLVVIANEGFAMLKEKGAKDSEVVNAINDASVAKLREHLAANPAAASEVDTHGRPPLAIAAYSNIADPKVRSELDVKRAGMIPELVAKGAIIDAKDHDGWSPLMWAAWSDMPKTAAVLIENGASPATADKHGNTALILAARRGNVEIVRLLATTGDSSAALEQAKTGLDEYPEKKAAYHAIIPMLEKK